MWDYVKIFHRDAAGIEVATVAKWRGGDLGSFVGRYIELLTKRGLRQFIPHRAIAFLHGRVSEWENA